MDVVLAAPRQNPLTNGRAYVLTHDRERTYLTLRAAFNAAAQTGRQVLVLSDFGCDMGHPPQEVASLIHKVLYEFSSEFKAVYIAIPPTTSRKEGVRTSFEEFQQIFRSPLTSLLYWSGGIPQSTHVSAH